MAGGLRNPSTTVADFVMATLGLVAAYAKVWLGPKGMRRTRKR